MKHADATGAAAGVAEYAVFLLDLRGCVLGCNAEGLTAASHRAEDMLGRDFLSLYGLEGNSAAALHDAMQGAAAAGHHVEKDVVLERRGGHPFHARLTVDGFSSAHGDLQGFVVIVCDRSERKEVEERLRESERRFRLFVNGVADHAICMLDLDGAILDWNLGAQRVTHFQLVDVARQHYRVFFHEHDQERRQPERLLARAAQAGHVAYECDLIRRDGSAFPACVTLEAIHDADGCLLCFGCIIRDETEHRLMERRLREAHAQVAHSQKIEAIGQLTGGIAHDFNNSLQGIISSLEMASLHLEHAQPQNAQRYVNVALEAAVRAGGLTQRLLGLARRQAQPHHRTLVVPMLDALQEVLGRVLGDSITLDVMMEDDLPPVACDSAQLESALLNLAINARDAMKGHGRLVLRIRQPSNEQLRSVLPEERWNQHYVEFSVADNGHGMDEATRRRAFEPFFTTKPKDHGTGLGLAMVAGFVAQYGGAADIHSVPGRGTVVTLLLPCGPAEAAPSPPPSEVPESDLSGLRVLVVENDNTVRNSISARLHQLGCQVFEAATGREALLTLAACPSWDLLLSDIDLPELDGYELCREARHRFPMLRVILMTGYADSELVHGEFADGHTESLIKPFDMGALLTKVRLLVGVTH